MLTICCITYNHENTIKNTIDGFLMQKTNFDYHIYIHDDCSTDGTIDILKEYENKYPNKINVLYQKENQFSKGKKNPFVHFIFPKINSKYIALCEGDDWWTDENKLQIQVDLLESNNSLIGCFHKAEILDLLNNKTLHNHYPFDGSIKNKPILLLQDLCVNGHVVAPPTSSVVYKFNNFKESILKLYPLNIVNGDTWLAGFYLLNGNLAYINKTMSIRTINGNGIWEGKNADIKNIRFANEIISLPIEMEKLFSRYDKISPYDFTYAYESVVSSIINNNQSQIMEKINNNFHIKYYQSIQIHKQQQTEVISYIRRKYKKYKKLFFICLAMFITCFLSMVFFTYNII